MEEGQAIESRGREGGREGGRKGEGEREEEGEGTQGGGGKKKYNV